MGPTTELSPTNPLPESNWNSTSNVGPIGGTNFPEDFVEIVLAQMIRVAPPVHREVWSSMRISFDRLKFFVDSRFPEALLIFDSSLQQMELEARRINPAANSLTFWLQSPCDALHTMMQQLQNRWRKRLDRLTQSIIVQRHIVESTTDAWDMDSNPPSDEDIYPPTVADDSTSAGGKSGQRNKTKTYGIPAPNSPPIKFWDLESCLDRKCSKENSSKTTYREKFLAKLQRIQAEPGFPGWG